jgi:hypothetical protein
MEILSIDASRRIFVRKWRNGGEWEEWNESVRRAEEQKESGKRVGREWEESGRRGTYI